MPCGVASHYIVGEPRLVMLLREREFIINAPDENEGEDIEILSDEIERGLGRLIVRCCP